MREEQQNSLLRERRLAPRVGFEPTTLRLTAGRSTIELPRNGAAKSRNLILLAVCKQCQSNPPRRRGPCRKVSLTSCSINSRRCCGKRLRDPQSAGVTSPTPAKKGDSSAR